MKFSVILLLLFTALIGCKSQTPSAPQGNTGPVVLAKDENQPAAISVDDAYVYWVAESRTAIHRVSKTGGAITTVIKDEEGIRRMIVNGDFVYFLTNTQIRRAPKTGGVVTTLVTFADLGSAEITYWRLAVDQNNVYFMAGPDDELMKLSKAGGKPVALAKTFLPSNPVSDEADVYWFDGLSGVQKLSLAGGGAVTIGECEKGAALAVDSASIYCATELGKVLRFAKADKAVTTITAVENVPFDQVAVDEKNIYAVSVISGIYRIAKGGGQAEKLVPVDHQLVNFAMDASNFYWTNYDQGTVTRRAK